MLQIWVFPEQRNIKPRYEQKTFDQQLRINQWQLLAGPDPKNGEMEINQQAWFSRIDLAEGRETEYKLHDKQNGVYLFVIEGTVNLIEDKQLKKRDGAGIWEIDTFGLKAGDNSELLVIEVPMWE